MISSVTPGGVSDRVVTYMLDTYTRAAVANNGDRTRIITTTMLSTTILQKPPVASQVELTQEPFSRQKARLCFGRACLENAREQQRFTHWRARLGQRDELRSDHRSGRSRRDSRAGCHCPQRYCGRVHPRTSAQARYPGEFIGPSQFKTKLSRNWNSSSFRRCRKRTYSWWRWRVTCAW